MIAAAIRQKPSAKIVPKDLSRDVFDESKSMQAVYTSFEQQGQETVLSSDFFFEQLQGFYRCRKDIAELFTSMSGSSSLTAIPNIDSIRLADGPHGEEIFDPSMRQTSLRDGEPVANIEDLYKAANLVRGKFYAFLENVVTSSGMSPSSVLTIAPLKGQSRAEKKARDDYGSRLPGPPFAWLFDIVRAAIMCESPDEVLSIVRSLQDTSSTAIQGEGNALFRIVRLKNRFTRPTPGGFRDVNINICCELPIAGGNFVLKHVCELQIHINAIRAMGEQLHSHARYEYFRSYFRGSTTTIDNRLRDLESLWPYMKAAVDKAGPSAGGSHLLDALVDELIARGDKISIRAACDLFTGVMEFTRAEMLFRRLVAKRDTDIDEGVDAKGMFAETVGFAALLDSEGKPGEAEDLYRKLASEQERNYGINYPMTLMALDYLAECLMIHGKFEEADQLFQKILLGKEKLYGPNSSEALVTIGNRGTMFLRWGRLDEAEVLLREAFEGIEKAYGRDNNDSLLTCSNNLAMTLMLRGELDKAENLYEKTLVAKEKMLGPVNESTLVTVQSLAGLLNSKGKLDEAEALYRRVLAGQENALGLNNEKTLSAVTNLAEILKNQGKPHEVVALYRKTLSELEAKVGKEDLFTLDIVTKLGMVLKEQNKLDEAESLLRRALTGYETTLGPNDSKTLGTVHNLADVLKRGGQHGKEVNELAKKFNTALDFDSARTPCCQQGHSMTRFAYGQLPDMYVGIGLVGCDICRQLHIEQEAFYFHCDKCNYDLCLRCGSDATPPEAKRTLKRPWRFRVRFASGLFWCVPCSAM